tara:strand:+ start:1003 stop:1203 length:201 start_codon:yes stop_codon:yes gene_type:complete
MRKALKSIIAHSELALESLEESQEPYERSVEEFDFEAHMKNRSLKRLKNLLGEARMVARGLLEAKE